jgi:hypothetical protein
VLTNLTSPLPIGPFCFEDSPHPTVPAQEPPVVPPAILRPALDEVDPTLQEVLSQVDQEMAAQGVDTSNSHPRPDTVQS